MRSWNDGFRERGVAWCYPGCYCHHVFLQGWDVSYWRGVINSKGSVVEIERERRTEREIIKQMRCTVVKVLVGPWGAACEPLSLELWWLLLGALDEGKDGSDIAAEDRDKTLSLLYTHAHSCWSRYRGSCYTEGWELTNMYACCFTLVLTFVFDTCQILVYYSLGLIFVALTVMSTGFNNIVFIKVIVKVSSQKSQMGQKNSPLSFLFV